jgi:hypothetical protein
VAAIAAALRSSEHSKTRRKAADAAMVAKRIDLAAVLPPPVSMPARRDGWSVERG